MIVYRCDLCNDIHDSLKEMNMLSLYDAGTAKMDSYKEGKFHLCSCCTNRIINMFKEAENQLKPECKEIIHNECDD